jgi:hypothetical protein
MAQVVECPSSNVRETLNSIPIAKTKNKKTKKPKEVKGL